MQKDFHFYCIGVLARAAGFSIDDALIIAYASQYVDNSTEGKLIQLESDASDIKVQDPTVGRKLETSALSCSRAPRQYALILH